MRQSCARKQVGGVWHLPVPGEQVHNVTVQLSGLLCQPWPPCSRTFPFYGAERLRAKAAAVALEAAEAAALQKELAQQVGVCRLGLVCECSQLYSCFVECSPLRCFACW